MVSWKRAFGGNSWHLETPRFYFKVPSNLRESIVKTALVSSFQNFPSYGVNLHIVLCVSLIEISR